MMDADGFGGECSGRFNQPDTTDEGGNRARERAAKTTCTMGWNDLEAVRSAMSCTVPGAF